MDELDHNPSALGQGFIIRFIQVDLPPRTPRFLASPWGQINVTTSPTSQRPARLQVRHAQVPAHQFPHLSRFMRHRQFTQVVNGYSDLDFFSVCGQPAARAAIDTSTNAVRR